MATRYKISKEQLERVVENFVMEAASKATVKNMIPSQGAEAKKHVKNKMTGKMVEKGEGVPSVNTMKKKLSQAPESKKHMSNSKMTHSNKAKVVKENELEEGFFGELIGTKMNEKKATEIYEKRYATHLGNLTKKYNTDEDTMKKALIKALTQTGSEILRLNPKDVDALQWDSEKGEFIKKGSKSGGTGGVVGG